MNDNVKNYLAFVQEVSEGTEQALDEYFAKNKSEENLQFPNLVTMVGNIIKHDPKIVSDVDQHVRQYVRRHPEYRVSRGAKGGIMPIAVYLKREAAKAAQEAAKKVIAAQVEAKAAAAVVVPATAVNADVEVDAIDAVDAIEEL